MQQPLSTSIFIWEIIKWLKSGPNLITSVGPSVIAINMPSVPDDKVFTSITVRNLGQKPTTIENLGAVYWTSSFQKLFSKKNGKFMVIPNPHQYIGQNYSVPYLLEVGQSWSGYVLQTPEWKDMAKNGLLDLEFYDTFSSKPIRHRVQFKSGIDSKT